MRSKMIRILVFFTIFQSKIYLISAKFDDKSTLSNLILPKDSNEMLYDSGDDIPSSKKRKTDFFSKVRRGLTAESSARSSVTDKISKPVNSVRLINLDGVKNI